LSAEVKLYSVSFSPFAARCRIAIYAKGLDIKIVLPHSDVGSEGLKRLNPTAKVPFLQAAGLLLTESEVICEYLEDLNPRTPLRPADPYDRARMRLFSRLSDLYVVEPMFPIYPQLRTDPQDKELVDKQIEKICSGLEFIEQYTPGTRYVVCDRLTLGDCSLAPTFYYIDFIFRALERGNAWSAFPKLGAYWQGVQKDPFVARVLGEITAGLDLLGDRLHHHFLTGSDTSGPS
jgi:glutathione S-transferase